MHYILHFKNISSTQLISSTARKHEYHHTLEEELKIFSNRERKWFKDIKMKILVKR